MTRVTDNRRWFEEQMREVPFILLDGAIGTELERAGYRTSLPLWSAMAAIEVPQLLEDLHTAYLRAGAQILTANTFRTTRYTMAMEKQADLVPELVARAIRIAQRASDACGHDVVVAASLAPLEDCYRPDLVPDDSVIETHYREQIRLLLNCGADIILAETMLNASEVRSVTHLCAEFHLPLIISLLAESGALLDGTPLEVIIPEIQASEPLAILLNCRDVQVVSENLSILRSLTDLPIGAYANGPGKPDPEVGWEHDAGGLEAFVDAARSWVSIGARIIGGCCGTTPAHIAALHMMRASLRE